MVQFVMISGEGTIKGWKEEC